MELVLGDPRVLSRALSALAFFSERFRGKALEDRSGGKSMQLLCQPKEETLFVSPSCPISAYFARFLAISVV